MPETVVVVLHTLIANDMAAAMTEMYDFIHHHWGGKHAKLVHEIYLKLHAVHIALLSETEGALKRDAPVESVKAPPLSRSRRRRQRYQKIGVLLREQF